jgi:hypothetical protein
MWPFICFRVCCMATLPERANSRQDQLVEKEVLEAALCAAIENVHFRAESRFWSIVCGFPVRIVVLAMFFLLSGGIAAALIHWGVRSADSLFHFAGF